MISQKLPKKNAPGNCTNKTTPDVGTVLNNPPIQVTMGKRPEVGALGKDMAPDGGAHFDRYNPGIFQIHWKG